MINQYQLYNNTIFSLKTQRIFPMKTHYFKSWKIQSNIIVRFAENGRFLNGFVIVEGIFMAAFIKILGV